MAERKPNRKLTDQEVEYMLAKAVVQQVPEQAMLLMMS